MANPKGAQAAGTTVSEAAPTPEAAMLSPEEIEAIAASAAKAVAEAAAPKVALIVTELSDVWKVRGFKHAKSRPFAFADGTGAQTRMAEVIVEIGSTGIFQTGIGIVMREYGKTASPALAGKKGFVVQMNRRSVGGGDNKSTIAIFEPNGDEAEMKLMNWRRAVVKAYDGWLKAQGRSAASLAADVFDGDAFDA
jgi:hypothetical protein